MALFLNLRKWCLLVLCLVSLKALGQRIIKIEGVVIDSLTNELLSDVAVATNSYNKIYGQITDKQGHFALFLPQGKHTVSFKLPGYVPWWFYINDQSPDQTMTVRLGKVEHQLEQVVISTKGYDETVKKPLLGVNQINIKTLSKIPAAFGELDFLRGIQRRRGLQRSQYQRWYDRSEFNSDG